MRLSEILLISSAVFYGAAFLLHLFSFWRERGESHRFAFSFLRIGFLLATFYFVTEALEQGYFLPVMNFSQAMAFFAWSLAFVYLVLLVKIQSDSFGLILTPILLLLVAAAALVPSQAISLQDLIRTKPFLRDPNFGLHIVSAFFAYASFTLSFAAGILYLIQHHELKSKHAGPFYQKLPSLEELEKLIYQPLLWGTPLLLAAIGIGFLWSKSAFGKYWIFDPKTLLTAITLFIYSAILYFRHAASLRGKQAAILSLIAFSFVLFSFVGTRFIQGSHNFLR